MCGQWCTKHLAFLTVVPSLYRIYVYKPTPILEPTTTIDTVHSTFTHIRIYMYTHVRFHTYAHMHAHTYYMSPAETKTAAGVYRPNLLLSTMYCVLCTCVVLLVLCVPFQLNTTIQLRPHMFMQVIFPVLHLYPPHYIPFCTSTRSVISSGG